MNGHPNDIIITDLITVIKLKQREKNEITVTMDENESFISDKGGISK